MRLLDVLDELDFLDVDKLPIRPAKSNLSTFDYEAAAVV